MKKLLFWMFIAFQFYIYADARSTHDRIDLAGLINIFLVPESAKYAYPDWRVGADINTPIHWKTKGRESNCDGSTNPNYDAPERCGYAFVTINGKISHTVLEKTVQPGAWDIFLFGSELGVNKIELHVDADSEINGVVDYLKKSNLRLSLLSGNYYRGANNEIEVYQINSQGKQMAWLKNEHSCGVSGQHCGYTLTVFMDMPDLNLQKSPSN